MKRILVLALFAAALPAHAQSQAEAAFSAAANWTVFVRGALETPFIEDEQGGWTGSGFLVDRERGWILTNAHVASHSPAQIVVSFRGGKAMSAERVYVDPYLDVAVLRYNPSAASDVPSPPALACHSLPPTGHPVGAFGHPWGYRYTGTRGITSAMTAKLGPDMIQTDAPINEGNSGGALLSLESGAVVGINAAKAVRGREKAEGIGFAVPIGYACRILALLRENRDPSPPAHLVHFAKEEGGEPTLTVADSRLATDSIELQSGDTITAAFGRKVATQGQLVDALRGELDRVELTVERGGGTATLKGRWPAADRVTARQGLMVAGALLASTPSTFSAFLAHTPPLMIHHVGPGSEAEAAELATQDLVVSIDGHTVATLDALRARIRAAQADGRPMKLVLMRLDGQPDLFVYHRGILPAEEPQLVGGSQKKGPQIAGR